MSIEEALKREDEIYQAMKEREEATRKNNLLDFETSDRPSPRDYTLQEWIELWHEANQSLTTVASEPICEWKFTYSKPIIVRY